MNRAIPSPHRVALRVALTLAGTIGHAAAQDLSVVAITAPQGGCALGSSENVTIRLFNYDASLPAGTAFNVAYTINAGAPVTEMVVLGSSLLRNSAFTYTFTTPADLSIPGMYTFGASVNLPGDINPANNGYGGWIATNTAPSVGGMLVGPGAPSASGTLTLSGETGDVVQWEESDDGGQRWFALANTTTSQDYAGLRAPAQFRVRVRNSPCADAVSNVATASP